LVQFRFEAFARSGADLLSIFPPSLDRHAESAFTATPRRNTEHGWTHHSIIEEFARDHIVIANVLRSEADAAWPIELSAIKPIAGASSDGHIPSSSIENP
jgi:hypothetical protein